MYSMKHLINEGQEMHMNYFLENKYFEIFEKFDEENKKIIIELFTSRNELKYDKFKYTFIENKTVEKIWERKKGLEVIENTLGISELFNHMLCPICSVAMCKMDIDHFFPKKKFGALVLFPFNLTPCCGDCNSNDKSGKISFHPYLDEIEGDLIQVRLEYSNSLNRLIYKGYEVISITQFGKEYKELCSKKSVSLGINRSIESQISYINCCLDQNIMIEKIIGIMFMQIDHLQSLYSVNNIKCTINKCIIDVLKNINI